MPWSSNATFLVSARRRRRELAAIYKPQRGERPLWDFPRGTLCNREVAAYRSVVCARLGHRPRHGPARRSARPRHGAALRRPRSRGALLHAARRARGRVPAVAVFDVVINNTDRKGGHCLRASRHDASSASTTASRSTPQWKVRTVIWDFAGNACPTPTPTTCAARSRSSRRTRAGTLADLLTPVEIEAIVYRGRARSRRASPTPTTATAPPPGLWSDPQPPCLWRRQVGVCPTCRRRNESVVPFSFTCRMTDNLDRRVGAFRSGPPRAFHRHSCDRLRRARRRR